MKRKIITIDESKCNGCGLCVPNCHEGAIQIIDGKARLVSEVFCDGLGACLGHCPEDAIIIEKREALPFDQEKVDQHLNKGCEGGGCPGAKAINFTQEELSHKPRESALRQWPVQFHLITPQAEYFKGADLLLSADCVAYSLGNFHDQFLKDKRLIIACPKLDAGKESYLEKLKALIDETKINTLTVLTMEVPCCEGLLGLAREVISKASRRVPLKSVMISLQGDSLKEEWL